MYTYSVGKETYKALILLGCSGEFEGKIPGHGIIICRETWRNYS